MDFSVAYSLLVTFYQASTSPLPANRIHYLAKHRVLLCTCITGLSIRAGSRPKSLASHPSLANYFRLILPVLLMKNLTALRIPSKKLVKHPFTSFEWN